MEVGFYGKLPSHGDFLRRRASEEFVRAWDAWLQEGIAASREALSDRWLDIYLTSPVWRFACAAGVAGPTALAGVMAPSVDRVGRYFPITVVAELPPDEDVVSLAVDGSPFFDAAEQLVLQTLETEHVDLEDFDTGVLHLAGLFDAMSRPKAVALDASSHMLLAERLPAGWQLPLGELGQLDDVLRQLLSRRLGALYAPLSVWWTSGSDVVVPSCLFGRGLPAATGFAALLDGEWRQHAWSVAAAQVTPREGSEFAGQVIKPRFQMRSEGATDVGKVRQVNQDAFLERAEAGLWAVADGLGGHADGEIASHMVCDALADLAPTVALEDMVSAVAERLQEVNEELLRASTRSLLGDTCGSTVVTLLVRGERLAVLWAGDSRAYRWRAGALDQLTRDHSAAVAGAGRVASTAITRAVGAEPTLAIDVVWGDVRPGDRYLLCSDGLTRTVPDDRLASGIETAMLRQAVDDLVKESLASGAPDNVTVVIAEATPNLT